LITPIIVILERSEGSIPGVAQNDWILRVAMMNTRGRRFE
jgi:hypothetical protein